MKRAFMLMAVGSLLIFGSCKGPQGDTGPRGDAGPQGVQGVPGSAGPQGSAGPIGATGPKGSTGAQGDPASALQYKLNRGITTATDGSFFIYVDLTPEGMKKVEDGVVLLYVQYDSYWYLIPATLQHAGNAYSYTMRYSVKGARLQIDVSRLQTTGINSSFAVAFDNARMVIIPAANARINYEDYEAVKAAYNLQD